MTEAPVIGSLIHNYFKLKRIFKAALARKMNLKPSSISYCLKQKSVQTQFLWDLSVALEHNFYQDIANLLPENYSVTTPNNIDLKNQIAALEKQVLILTTEKEILLKTLGK